MTDQIAAISKDQRQNHPVLTAAIHPDVLGKLLTANGLSVTPGALAEICNRNQVGNTPMRPVHRLSGILDGVGKRGLHVCQLRWDRMDRHSLPALVFYGQEWMFAEAAEENTVRLSLPGGDVVSLAAEDIGQAPVLWFKKPDVAASETGGIGTGIDGNEKTRAAGLLIKELLKDKQWLGEVLVATVVINVMAVASSLFAMQVYDRVVPTFAYATLTALVAGMLIVSCLDWALKFIRARIIDALGKQVDESMAQHLFDHVMQLRLDIRPRNSGTLAAQMRGLEQVRNFFSSTIVFFMTDMPFCFFFLFIIHLIGGPVAYVYAVLLPIALVIGWIAQKRLSRLARSEVRTGYQRHGLLVEAIQGAETIQSNGSLWQFSDQWARITRSIAAFGFKNKSITSTAVTTTGTLSTLGYVSALVVGVTCVEKGTLTTGGMIACAILGGRIINPVAMGVRFMVQWEHVKESLTMINRLLSLETIRHGDTLFPDLLEDSLTLEGVRFSYPNSPIVCLDVPSLALKAGDRVVILGPNGCGKSTLLKVMAGLFRPSEGQVRLGGAHLFDLDPRVVTEQVGYLPQDVHLFKGTLKTNMALGGGVSDADLIEVANLLGIDRIAAQNPRSMDLDIFEGGQGLSGGQRQLTALARLFLARPRIWLLDEPSAALDIESENQVLSALKQRARPSDIVVIATHRPRLTSLANRVVVMGRGRIVKDGPPDISLSNNRFARILPARRTP